MLRVQTQMSDPEEKQPRRSVRLVLLLLSFFSLASIGLAVALGVLLNRDHDNSVATTDITDGCGGDSPSVESYLTKCSCTSPSIRRIMLLAINTVTLTTQAS